jgi:hypothetical protein
MIELVLAAAPIHAAEIDPADAEFFERKIRPVLAEACFSCHSRAAKKKKGGAYLDSRAAMLKGGDSGPSLVPGDPAKSRLIEAVVYKSVDLQMPPKGKLPDAAIADLTEWVRRGAPWPGDDKPTREPGAVEAFDLAKRRAEHWAWQPLQAVQPPAGDGHAVDRFLRARLAEKGLTPAGIADRRTLIRRASFDLIGLPPTPEEVEAFVADGSPDAWEKVIDRLLASPHFGERWGRHWLDLVRFAESRGHEFDYTIPNAWQYRDYVVRAINADVPYDRFVAEHVAGDLLAEPRRHPAEGFNESILGTGFFFLGEEVHSPVDVRADQADRFDNRIDVLGKTFLGLTISCARCHDHKFDAISTKDYYALFAVLESCSYRPVRFDTLDHNRRVVAEMAAVRGKGRASVGKALAEALQPAAGRLPAYLSAARQVLASASAEQEKAIRAAAAGGGLDPGRLGKWIGHLAKAAGDPADPFHPWARVCLTPASERDKPPAELLAPVAEAWRRKAAVLPAGATVVIDYARSRPTEFLPDDATFGTAPVRPGDLRVDGAAVRFAEGPAAAEFDGVWTWPKLKDVGQPESGTLGFPRAGRTLRTPTFTLTTGRVWILARGPLASYAAVGQHVMIQGPLHGGLVRRHKGDRRVWRWVPHDLTGYAGRRCHLEFTATDGDQLAVAMVIESDTPPPAFDPPNALSLELITGGPAASADALAAAYGKALSGVAERLAADGMTGDQAGDRARLANWFLDRPELLDPAAADRIRAAAAETAAAHSQAAAKIQATSRLALSLTEGTPVEGRVFIRGSHKAEGEPVPRRYLEALSGAEPLSVDAGSGRLELARRMTDPAVTPLVPRVMANRVWHHLFGRGIVGSTDDFGFLGERPTHPELLDWLADRFVRDGWSVKRLIRTLMLTEAYRMESRRNPAAAESDPANRLLHRANVRRLEGEAIRDAMLAISGRLDRTMSGPSVPVHLTNFQDGRGRPASGPLDGAGRRSLYLAVRRNFLSAMLLAFDTPQPFSTVGRRTASNVPAQSLILMNDPFVHQQAGLWAKRVLAAGGTPQERIAAMYRSAFARPPTEGELAAAADFLAHQSAANTGRDAELSAWTDLAHALFNVKEFVYLK